MKCLVTGGAGTNGSRLCEELLLAGNIVIALDDLGTGKIENMLRLYQFSSFRFIQGSIRD
ncbi:MAG TPA: NAD-dependent epimerase/dehydratase family protein, partial [Candidatus Kapabacteria bacterium]|nr:NAD-dependent epimerase/dehydratase family protein [Candidatus Kapabacteria bacterium]